MAVQIPFHIMSGIPFAKTLVVTLPSGRTWWTARSQFEVLSQIREATNVLSPLILDLTKFLSVYYASPNTVTIDLVMTGDDTRQVTKSGYYDIVISDIFAIDGRATQVLAGQVHRTSLVTSGQQVVL